MVSVPPERRPLRVECVGTIAYEPMLELQKRRHLEVVQGESDDTLFLLEHTPVITLGKNASETNVLVSRERLSNLGIDCFEAGRGGDVTYHGPGQIVGYPILALQPGPERDIRRFVGVLEELMIRVVGEYGIEARRLEGMRGIWAGGKKIGAVGVRVARWTTMHGFALNVSTNLEDFQHIVPCGLHGYQVTSMAELLGQTPSQNTIEQQIVAHAGELLERSAYLI